MQDTVEALIELPVKDIPGIHILNTDAETSPSLIELIQDPFLEIRGPFTCIGIGMNDENALSRGKGMEAQYQE
jgi:hypothetical protein